jgi:methyl-accepting chemotaxis protein
MKKIGLSHIRRWLLFYLAVVSLTAMVMLLMIYLEILATMDHLAIKTGTELGPATVASLKASLAPLRLRLILLLITGIAILLLAGYAWLGIAARRIERPLHTLERALGQLAKGRLNETVLIDTPDEFGRMGAGINEVAVNLQELLLYVWKQTGQCLTLIDHIHNNPDLTHDRKLTLESLGYLKQLSESIDDLRDMAKAYVFYDVSIEGNRTRAIDDPIDDSPDASVDASLDDAPGKIQ